MLKRGRRNKQLQTAIAQSEKAMADSVVDRLILAMRTINRLDIHTQYLEGIIAWCAKHQVSIIFHPNNNVVINVMLENIAFEGETLADAYEQGTAYFELNGYKHGNLSN